MKKWLPSLEKPSNWIVGVVSQPGAVGVGCSQIGSVNIPLRSYPTLVTMGMNGTLHPGIRLSKSPTNCAQWRSLNRPTTHRRRPNVTARTRFAADP